MAVDYTNTEFIATVKRIASFPNSQNLLEDSDILKNASKEMRATVVPLYLKNRDDFFVKYKDFTSIMGTSEYDIPTRALGGIIHDVQIIDTSGSIWHMPRLDPVSNLQGDNGYYFKGNKIVLTPTPTNNDYTLRLVYYIRPNEMVEVDNCGAISSINTGLNQVVCATVPNTWVVGTQLDFISSTPNFDTLAEASAIVTIASTTITFSSLPTGLVVGDYLADAGEAPYCQMPIEGRELLAQLSALKCLEEMGDDKNYQITMARYGSMADDLVNLISPRSHDEGKFIRNQTNFLGRRSFWWG